MLIYCQFGQGGNQAIESVAVLTNCLVEVLSSLKSKTHRPSDLDMYAALQKYQHLRQDRSKTFVNLSGIITRDEALDTLSHTLRFLFFPPFTTEQLSGELHLYYITLQTAVLTGPRYANIIVQRCTDVKALTIPRAITWKQDMERYCQAREDRSC